MPHRPDLSVGNLLPAALGGIAAALITSGFGVAGSLIGAALAPVAYLFVKELTRAPTEHVARRAAPRPARQTPERVPVGVSSGAGEGPPEPEHVSPADRSPGLDPPRKGTTKGQVRRYRRRRWRVLAATAGLAFVIAVGAITVPELITGSSLTTERRTTFFNEAPASGGSVSTPSDAPATNEGSDPAEEADEPADVETPAPTDAPSVEEGATPESEAPPAAEPGEDEPLPAPEADAPTEEPGELPEPAPAP